MEWFAAALYVLLLLAVVVLAGLGVWAAYLALRREFFHSDGRLREKGE